MLKGIRISFELISMILFLFASILFVILVILLVLLVWDFDILDKIVLLGKLFITIGAAGGLCYLISAIISVIDES